MSDSLKKAFYGVITLGISCIAIELIPVSRKAAYWNRCLDGTVKLLETFPAFNEWPKQGKESLAVAMCNGAVHQPKLQNEK